QQGSRSQIRCNRRCPSSNLAKAAITARVGLGLLTCQRKSAASWRSTKISAFLDPWLRPSRHRDLAAARLSCQIAARRPCAEFWSSTGADQQVVTESARVLFSAGGCVLAGRP